MQRFCKTSLCVNIEQILTENHAILFELTSKWRKLREAILKKTTLE